MNIKDDDITYLGQPIEEDTWIVITHWDDSKEIMQYKGKSHSLDAGLLYVFNKYHNGKLRPIRCTRQSLYVKCLESKWDILKKDSKLYKQLMVRLIS